MTDTFRGRRILVVEDEYLLADDLRAIVQGLGADVLGPVAEPAAALALIDGAGRIDAALLDINLAGTPAFGIADALRRRGVPFAFVTGYDPSVLPERFSETAWIEKPAPAPRLAAVLTQLLVPA